MKENIITYKDNKGCEIVAEFFDDKVQYKKDDSRCKRVVSYKKFLLLINKFGWVKK